MKRVLPVIVIAQFFCTSLWFAGNAVIADIVREFHVEGNYVAHLTSAVQFGFICGTLVFAVLSIADRFSPSRVFLFSAIIAAILNLAMLYKGIGVEGLIATRCLTGFFLAGIYPVGMKIAADHFREGLGTSLGFLVGALVLGTALPHLLKGLHTGLPWQYVIITTTILAFAGGLFLFVLVPDGPYCKAGQKLDVLAFLNGFKEKNFRTVAFGYFGHMWELYTFWVFVPVMLTAYNMHYPTANINIPLWSFLIIAVGSLSCIGGGYLSKSFGVKRTATLALGISCACCLLSPLLLFTSSSVLFLFFLFIWSIAVIADSPLFSTLVATYAPAAWKGSSLTIVNCIGFSITIISIQLMRALLNDANAGYIYLLLALGPVLGLFALFKK